jgi:protoheme ferro-lyase
MWEAMVRAKFDGLQHCYEHINKAGVGNTASILCAFLEDMYYCIETLCELDVENSEQFCSLL